jgi:hypothetical protein
MLSSTDIRTLLSKQDYIILNKAALWSQPWHTELPLYVLLPQELEGDAEKMPLLIPTIKLLDPQKELLCDSILASAKANEEPLPACLLAAPDTNLDNMRRHLIDRLILHSPQGRMFFRYFDPLVFAHLSWILDATQIATLFGPIQTWTFPFQNDWISQKAADVPVSHTPWAVRAEQREKLNRVGAINVTLDRWQKRQNRPWRDLAEYLDLTHWVERAVETGQRKHQLKSSDELSDFALDTLALPEHARADALAGR